MKEMITFSDVAIKNMKNMDNTWYMDTAATVYITYNLNLYIIFDLDH